MPNVFTPNGDGLNDYFFPSVSPEIIEMSTFAIINPSDGTLIWSRLHVGLGNEKIDGWDGNLIDGTPFEGQFTWEIFVITKDDLPKTLTGTGCRIVCGENAVVFKTKEGCYYSEQANDGVLDAKVEIKETDCFK